MGYWSVEANLNSLLLPGNCCARSGLLCNAFDLIWPMAGANSGVINEDVLDETAFLQELRQLLELSNSSESASLLRQHEASSL